MKKIDITLLSEEQVFNKEGMFQIIGRTACPTDYALQSGCMRPTDKNTSPYYTKTLNKYGMVKFVDAGGYKKQIACSSRNLGIRPVFKYSQIKEYLANEYLMYKGKNMKIYKAEGFEDLIEVCSQTKQQELEEKAIHSFLTDILLKNLIPSNPRIIYLQECPKEESENRITLSLDNIKNLLSAKEIYCLNNQQQIVTITLDEDAKKVLKKSSLKSFLP